MRIWREISDLNHNKGIGKFTIICREGILLIKNINFLHFRCHCIFHVIVSLVWKIYFSLKHIILLATFEILETLSSIEIDKRWNILQKVRKSSCVCLFVFYFLSLPPFLPFCFPPSHPFSLLSCCLSMFSLNPDLFTKLCPQPFC